MYIPKNKILTDQKTNGGEFIYKKNNSSYIGFYHKLYNGKIYTGKNPNDPPIEELISVIDKEKTDLNINSVALNPDINIINSDWNHEEIIKYRLSKNKDINDFESKKIPVIYYPKIKESDYELGEFQRYFIKKLNENKFWEIEKKEYQAIKSKDTSYLFELFLPLTFSWQITGNRIEVLKTNYKTVILIQQQNKILGLDFLFKNKYDEFYQYPIRYNLETKGNELVDSSNSDYIGKYYIDQNKGFISDDKRQLYPLNKVVENQLFIKILGEIQVSTIYTYDSIKKK